MAIATSTLLASAAVVAAAGAATAGVASSNKSSKTAKSAAEEQARKNRELENQMRGKMGTEAADSKATSDQARNRQRQIAASASGRRATILTSPLGAVSGDTTKGKTLLGA